MYTFIFILVIFLVLIYIGHKAFFSTDGFANTVVQSNNPSKPTDSKSINSNSNSTPTLYIFKSTTCPACQMYNSGNGPIVRKVIGELGLQIKEIDLDSGKPLDSSDKNVYDKCGVQYIPTACLVNSNGDIKQLGNGNGLNKEMIMDAIKN